jgi:hypothetical protein
VFTRLAWKSHAIDDFPILRMWFSIAMCLITRGYSWHIYTSTGEYLCGCLRATYINRLPQLDVGLYIHTTPVISSPLNPMHSWPTVVPTNLANYGHHPWVKPLVNGREHGWRIIFAENVGGAGCTDEGGGFYGVESLSCYCARRVV